MSNESSVLFTSDTDPMSAPPSNRIMSKNLLSRKRLFWLLILCGITVLCLGFNFVKNSETTIQNTTPHSLTSTPRTQYLDILAEPHMGMRLARLRGFARKPAATPETKRAALAVDILTTHEQEAWAALSDIRYNLRKTQAQKQAAVQSYTDVWGVWSRQEQLDDIIGTKAQIGEGGSGKTDIKVNNNKANYVPNRKRSKFAQSKTPDTLAGAVPTAIYTPPPALKPVNQPKINTTPTRIKYAKRPRYPKRAHRRGIEAKVTLALDIDERGHVARAHVVSVYASRYAKDFARAARRAALRSKFHPANQRWTPLRHHSLYP